MEVWRDIKKTAFIIIYALIIAYLLMNILRLKTDDSDLDGFHRSGFEVLTDYRTGKQYLYRGGYFIPRTDKNGKQIYYHKKGK